MVELIVFLVAGAICLGGAVGVIVNRNPVHAALSLVATLFGIAVLFIAQEAHFLAAVQVIVYTGAVMMLFLIVLMLVGVDTRDSLVETIRGQRFWAAVAGLGFAVLLALAIGQAVIADPVGLGEATQAAGGNVPALARLIFTRHVFAFEVASALLITAALGAMVLAHRERTREKPTQKDLSRARFISGRPTPLPGPGVYARNNASDMPALLPDGTVSELSVNRVIARYDVAEGRLPEDPRLAEAIRQAVEEEEK